MANYELNQAFNSNLRKVERKDLVHADYINTIFRQLINNDNELYKKQYNALPAAFSVTRNVDGTINTIVKDGVIYTLTYNEDGALNTISDGSTTRTMQYTDGLLSAIV